MDNKTIKLGEWFNIYTEPIIETDEGARLNVAIPRNYDNSLPIFDPIDGYNTCTMANNYDHFASLLDNEIRVSVVDGEHLTEMSQLYRYCDYCGTNIDTKGYPIRSCSECKKSMCSLCWEEKTEEIAEKNGAKNWSSRKDELLTCFSHQDKISVTQELPVNCDICEKSSKNISGKWHCNRGQNKDVCLSCFYSQRGQAFLSSIEGKWTETEYKQEPIMHTFGSMLDWVVLLEDEDEYDYLLYNINKDSPNYHKIALVAIDNHGRQGFYIVPGTLEENLTKLRTNKIKAILSELHHEVHFG
jgi:hypothetical protein